MALPRRRLRAVGGASDDQAGTAPSDDGVGGLMALVAQGDAAAYERLYDRAAGPVYGMVLQVLRDPAQSEEVAQEVLVDVWRAAGRYDPARGSAWAWMLTMARRRAVDRVRSVRAADDREVRAAMADATRDYDEVAGAVETRLEHQQVRRCLGGLTELQRESVALAYYRGLTQTEVARLLGIPLGTVKTRLRDGLIRLRDCLGVA